MAVQPADPPPDEVMRAELERLEQLRASFINSVSHDLRTPLTSIKAMVSLVLEGDLGPISKAQQESLALADRELDRMAQLISNLLDFQRLEAGQLRLQWEQLNLAEIVRQVVASLDWQARQHGVAIRALAPDRLPPVRGDRPRMEQILLQLLNNGIKFTPAGGSLEASVGYEEGLLVVRVADNGIGIPSHLLDRIFERFFQVDPDSGMGGTGIGLAIAKQLVELHGGHLFAASSEGYGSVFTFTLPPAS